jgi:hypothetical protein
MEGGTVSTKDEQRLFDLRYLRAQIDAEIAVLEWENRPKRTRTPKGQRPDCGTTKGYDWHRNHNELPACDDCKRAKSDYEKARVLRKRSA